MGLFGETKGGYGLEVDINGDKVVIAIRKGHSCGSVEMSPSEARALAREIYRQCKEVE